MMRGPYTAPGWSTMPRGWRRSTGGIDDAHFDEIRADVRLARPRTGDGGHGRGREQYGPGRGRSAAHADRRRARHAPRCRDRRPVPLARGPAEPRDARLDRRAEPVHPVAARAPPDAAGAPYAPRGPHALGPDERAARARRPVLLHAAA